MCTCARARGLAENPPVAGTGLFRPRFETKSLICSPANSTFCSSRGRKIPRPGSVRVSGQASRAQAGFTLMLALMVGLLLFVMAGMSLSTSLSVSQGEAAGGDSEGAWWLARSGLVRAASELARDDDWATAAPVEQVVQMTDGEGHYAVRVSHRTTNFNDTWLVTSVGRKGLASRRLVAVIRPDSYSRYSFLTNHEETGGGDPIWFIGADVIHGPVFTNGRFYMYDNPTFRGTVGSVSTTWRHGTRDGTEDVQEGQTPRRRPAPDMQQGFQGGQAPDETLRDSAGRDEAMNDLRALATAGGRVVTGRHRVDLQGDTVVLQRLDSRGRPTGSPTVLSLAALPSRVVFVDGAVEVEEGTLNGRLTLASTQDMTLTGNLRYHFRNHSDQPADDMLGLVSRANIIIHRDAPNNLALDASVLALGDSFYYAANGYGGNPSEVQGTLTMFGGIAQVRRGVMGTFSGSRILAGYSKDYQYDARLSSQAPPHFPNLSQRGLRSLVTVTVRDMQSLGAEP